MTTIPAAAHASLRARTISVITAAGSSRLAFSFEFRPTIACRTPPRCGVVTAFMTAVFDHARTIPVADIDVIAEIRGLDPKSRRARAWSIAERLAHALGDDMGARAIKQLRRRAPATIDLDSPFGPVFAELEMLVVYDVRVAHPSDDARQRGRLLRMIEDAQELGLGKP